MNIKEVKDLIHEVLQSDISEFELEHTGTKIRLRRGFSQEHASAASSHFNIQNHSAEALPLRPAPQLAQADKSSETNAADSDEESLHIITSPIVGTAYRAGSPGGDPFVKVGDHVKENTVLCIVEAMKLMNEIPSDVEGDIVQVYFENGTPVEFGQKLFAVRPSRQG